VRGERAADTHLAGVRHPRVMVLIGAAATVAAIAWALVLLSPASDHPASAPSGDNATDIPMTTLAVRTQQVPAAAEAAGHSMVQLRAVTGHGTESLVGVAVAEGGLLATTAEALSGLRSLWMIGPGGHALKASVLGVDGASDLALINVPVDVPVAPFADDTTLSVGTTAMMLNMAAPVTGHTMSLQCQTGSLTGIGLMIGSGWAKGMPTITSTTTAQASHQEEPGDPLLNQAGDVIGLLYEPGASSAYLPTELVLGVADDLRSSGRVSHGWLGVTGATAPGSGGAVVAGLMTGSPATGRLNPGEVVVALGSVPIHSMADLRGRLYVLPPNSSVDLSVADGSAIHVVDVTLGASP
jgi:S1-C subfamily serine protease